MLCDKASSLMSPESRPNAEKQLAVIKMTVLSYLKSMSK